MTFKKLSLSLISAALFGVTVAFAAGIPENVTNLKATAVDSSSVGLTWKAAKDAEGQDVKNYRIYYGTVSVLEQGSGDYEAQIDTPNSTPSFVVTGLKANTKYYFSATGLSTDAKESAEYSLEATATTKPQESQGTAGTKDTVAPKVMGVSAPDKTHVKVAFSESVQLPLGTPQASFGIVEQMNPAKELTVKSAVMDSTDTTQKTVLLETSTQTPNTNYIVTAGVAVKDFAGNPIVSGSTDSGLFLGSAVEATATTGNPGTIPPAAQSKDCGKDLACWLTHLADCSLATVTQADEAGTTEYRMELTGAQAAACQVKTTATKNTNPIYTATTMDCSVAKGSYGSLEDYNRAVDTKNCTGALVAGYKPLSTPKAKDTTPPENITSLLLSFRKELEKFTVMLNWTPSLNTAKDLVDQILYMSLDRGAHFDGGKLLGTSAAKTEVANLGGGKEYTFKITTKDASGNESTGVVKSIRLPQTGAGIGLLLLGSAFGAKRLLGRKKNKAAA